MWMRNQSQSFKLSGQVAVLSIYQAQKPNLVILGCVARGLKFENVFLVLIFPRSCDACQTSPSVFLVCFIVV